MVGRRGQWRIGLAVQVDEPGQLLHNLRLKFLSDVVRAVTLLPGDPLAPRCQGGAAAALCEPEQCPGSISEPLVVWVVGEQLPEQPIKSAHPVQTVVRINRARPDTPQRQQPVVGYLGRNRQTAPHDRAERVDQFAQVGRSL